MRRLLNPRKPTRARPHPYCSHAHSALLVISLIVLTVAEMILDAVGGLLAALIALAVMLVFSALVFLVVLGVRRLTARRLHVEQERRRRIARHRIRPGWARTAFILDLCLIGYAITGITLFSVGVVTESPASLTGFVLSIVLLSGIFAFWEYAHCKAVTD
jgi:hypothetical protein